MATIRLTSPQEINYPPARGPVLLLTCMDLRFVDEILQFMDHDGLTNRYDHVILAGASLGALGGCHEEYQHWKQTFFDHLGLAYRLHHIRDVYIIEHRDCGAYVQFLGPEADFHDEDADREAECHRKYAVQLQDEIEEWARVVGARLTVKLFLMDLRGHVALLKPPAKPKPKRPRKRGD